LDKTYNPLDYFSHRISEKLGNLRVSFTLTHAKSYNLILGRSDW